MCDSTREGIRSQISVVREIELSYNVLVPKIANGHGVLGFWGFGVLGF